jgi:hypothetical protein
MSLNKSLVNLIAILTFCYANSTWAATEKSIMLNFYNLTKPHINYQLYNESTNKIIILTGPTLTINFKDKQAISANDMSQKTAFSPDNKIVVIGPDNKKLTACKITLELPKGKKEINEYRIRIKDANTCETGLYQ